MSLGVRSGEEAPLTLLLDADGREVSLGAFRGEAVVLIYLRHLG